MQSNHQSRPLHWLAVVIAKLGHLATEQTDAWNAQPEDTRMRAKLNVWRARPVTGQAHKPPAASLPARLAWQENLVRMKAQSMR
jgi:hypothetical protein